MKVITTHRNTDFDGLACVCAAGLLYRDAVCALPRSVNQNVRAFLSIHKEVFGIVDLSEIKDDGITELIVVDTNSWFRLDGLKKLKDRKDLVVHLWDHHEGEGDIQAQFSCRQATGAAVTLLVERIKEEDRLITPMHATLFLAGIYEDTGNLSFPSTTPRDAHAAAYLLEQQADLNVISAFLRPAYGEMQKKVLYTMLKNAVREKINGNTISFNSVELDGHVDGLSMVVNLYREILNLDAAFGLFMIQGKKKKRCILIGRSSVDNIDVGEIMRGLGGGGHPGAGSVNLGDITIEDARAALMARLVEKSGNRIKVADLMSFPVFSVGPEISMSKVAQVLREKGVTGLPVVENGRIVGIVSRRDFKRIRKESHLFSPVKAFMSRNIMSISAGEDPVRAARIMVRHDIGRLPVIDGQGEMVGIVTRSDLMRYLYDLAV